jgi:23S rRNA G2445 N2-methylase RlmL
LRTVDDVYLHLQTWGGIARQRSTLARLTVLSGTLDFYRATRIVSRVRRLPETARFSVTASFVGKRNYTAGEMKLAVAEGVTRNVPDLQYVDDEGLADLNLRLLVEHETAWVGVRLAEHALHRRPYKRISVPGSLKAPVAASLVRIATAGVLPDKRRPPLLLDPFCRAGTILAEANLMGWEVVGGDLRSGVVHAARENLRAIGASDRVRRWDA